MARWIRLVKAHPTMASTWSTGIVLKYRTGEIRTPGDTEYPGNTRGSPGIPVSPVQYFNTILVVQVLAMVGCALTRRIQRAMGLLWFLQV